MKWTAGEAERECEGKDLGTGLSLIHNAPEFITKWLEKPEPSWVTHR